MDNLRKDLKPVFHVRVAKVSLRKPVQGTIFLGKDGKA
jgi:hypothetical protein